MNTKYKYLGNILVYYKRISKIWNFNESPYL
jgi:hypothetical protein